jgi:hypothetical protein
MWEPCEMFAYICFCDSNSAGAMAKKKEPLALIYTALLEVKQEWETITENFYVQYSPSRRENE